LSVKRSIRGENCWRLLTANWGRAPALRSRVRQASELCSSTCKWSSKAYRSLLSGFRRGDASAYVTSAEKHSRQGCRATPAGCRNIGGGRFQRDKWRECQSLEIAATDYGPANLLSERPAPAGPSVGRIKQRTNRDPEENTELYHSFPLCVRS